MKISEFNVLGLIIILLFFCATVLGACSDDDTTTTTSDTSASDEESWLFVQTAPSGTLTSNTAAQTSGSVAASEEVEYTLTLIDVDSDMIAFSDRPDRDVINLTVSEFVSQWDSYGFNDVPPNAALELMDPQDDMDVVIVELLNPVYDDDAGSLSYTVVPLSDEESFLESHEGRVDDIGDMLTEFDSVTLFIDGVGETQTSKMIFIFANGNQQDGNFWKHRNTQDGEKYCKPSETSPFYAYYDPDNPYMPVLAKDKKGPLKYIQDRGCDTDDYELFTIDSDGPDTQIWLASSIESGFEHDADQPPELNDYIRNEKGEKSRGEWAWTGTSKDGMSAAGHACKATGSSAFTHNGEETDGLVGNAQATDWLWSYEKNPKKAGQDRKQASCEEKHPIYCVKCITE